MGEQPLGMIRGALSEMFSNVGKARARCPHCRSVANCRSSREVTITHRERYLECTNVFCGFCWRTSESFDYGLRPSAIPDPKVELPMRVASRQDVLEMMRPADPAQPELFPPAVADLAIGDLDTSDFEPPG